MRYLGKDITYGHLKGQTETGDGSTAAYDLDYTINDGHAVAVYVGNVHQEPDVGYTVTGGGTSITFTENVPNGLSFNEEIIMGSLLLPSANSEPFIKRDTLLPIWIVTPFSILIL